MSSKSSPVCIESTQRIRNLSIFLEPFLLRRRRMNDCHDKFGRRIQLLIPWRVAARLEFGFVPFDWSNLNMSKLRQQ